MKFEILVEGKSDKYTVGNIIEKIVGKYDYPHTWKIIHHRGKGILPNDLNGLPDKRNRTLLHNLPSKLRAYNKTKDKNLVIIILFDLDDNTDCVKIKQEIVDIVDQCCPDVKCLIRIAIEELEAWFMGDQQAIKNAYPNAKIDKINSYVQDSQCGTWELLGDIIDSQKVRKIIKESGKGSQRLCELKCEWAKNISQKMDVENNKSPSYKQFRDGLRRYI